jgi:hypothetical protein
MGCYGLWKSKGLWKWVGYLGNCRSSFVKLAYGGNDDVENGRSMGKGGEGGSPKTNVECAHGISRFWALSGLKIDWWESQFNALRRNRETNQTKAEGNI